MRRETERNASLGTPFRGDETSKYALGGIRCCKGESANYPFLDDVMKNDVLCLCLFGY